MDRRNSRKVPVVGFNTVPIMLLTSHGTVVVGRRIYQLSDQKRREDVEMGVEGVQDVAEAKTGIPPSVIADSSGEHVLLESRGCLCASPSPEDG